MTSLLPYAAPLLAFVAAVTGLMGPSRRPDGIGFGALTPFGWAAATFALIGLLLTLNGVRLQREALRRAEDQLGQMRATAEGEFRDAIGLIADVLTFAALMPQTVGTGAPPGPVDRASVDLRSPQTLEALAGLRLDPGARLNAPYIPAAVPFSPSTRPAMEILAQESARALEKLQVASSIYAARAVDADVLDAASRLRQAPFLVRLTELPQTWQARSAIEDSTRPDIVNLYFLDDTTNPSPQAYLDLLDRMDRLRDALDTLTRRQ